MRAAMKIISSLKPRQLQCAEMAPLVKRSIISLILTELTKSIVYMQLLSLWSVSRASAFLLSK